MPGSVKDKKSRSTVAVTAKAKGKSKAKAKVTTAPGELSEVLAALLADLVSSECGWPFALACEQFLDEEGMKEYLSVVQTPCDLTTVQVTPMHATTNAHHNNAHTHTHAHPQSRAAEPALQWRLQNPARGACGSVNCHTGHVSRFPFLAG
jgi:hypothetical protein